MMPAWETTRKMKMTGIDPERLVRRWRWAAKQLGLSPQATAEEVRAAWLRRLPEEDFVPSSEARWALAALLHWPPEGGWEVRVDEAAAAAEEEQRRGEVEAFAAQFWDLPPAERRRRWDELRDLCAFAPVLRARLRLLEAGLDCASVGNDKQENARVIELAGHVRKLFVLRPGPRADARQSLLPRIQNDREWKVAARQLRRDQPALAALGNDLLDKLLSETPRLVHLEYGDNRVRRRVRQPAASNSGGSSSRYPIWIIVFIAVTLIRLFATAFKEPSSSSSPDVRFPSSLLHPTRNKENPPDALDKFFETQRIQDEKVKEEVRKEINAHFREIMEKGDKKDRTDGKNP